MPVDNDSGNHKFLLTVQDTFTIMLMHALHPSSRPLRVALSVLNYKSFQKFWKVKIFLNLIKNIEKNIKIYVIK